MIKHSYSHAVCISFKLTQSLLRHPQFHFMSTSTLAYVIIEQGIKRKCGQDINKRNFKRKFQANKSFNDNNNKPLINDSKKHPIIPKGNNSFPQVDDSKTLKPFAGILCLLEDITNDDESGDIEIINSIEDDEYITMDESVDKNTSAIIEPAVCGALSTLICNYESSDDESIDISSQLQSKQSENLNIKNNVVEQTDAQNSCEPVKNSTNFYDSEKSDNESGPEETKIVKDINNEKLTDKLISCNEQSSKLELSKTADQRKKHDKSKNYNLHNNPRRFKSKLPSTLLEKLLHNEIRQERNIVLQCIRYIVKNNYFEKPKN